MKKLHLVDGQIVPEVRPTKEDPGSEVGYPMVISLPLKVVKEPGSYA